MIPKEKAKKLFDKFYDLPIIHATAKDCALIAVDEILFEITDEDDISWFKKVKQEIEKL